jgi:hypothetical protein
MLNLERGNRKQERERVLGQQVIISERARFSPEGQL